MHNPFENRVLSLDGPAKDIVPVTPSDSTDLPDVSTALYVETGGTVNILTAAGETRSISLADYSFLPVGVRRVNATGTTAAGIHALVIT
jgi:hypothetical protein